MTIQPGELLNSTDLCKSFTDSAGKTLPILEGITFSLSAGRITSLLGASGCGKTTLLRILAGIESPDCGSTKSRIQLPGPKVGFVQQGEKLLPWRTVLENVALGLELLGKSKKLASELAREALDNVGLSDYFDCFPRQISGGMSQRVLLARALATRPDLLLLDEPLGQLDILARQELAAAIRSYVRSNNAAALLVTHSVEEAVFISDSILTLSLRPARIREHFVLDAQSITGQGGKVLSRKEAFPVIQNALLHALTRVVK